MRDTIAEVISVIFGAPWIVAVGSLVLLHSGLDRSQMQFMAIAFILLYLVLPGVYLVYALRKGYIEDIDFTKRQERYTIMSIYLIAQVLTLIFAYLHGTEAMVEKSIMILAVYTTIYLITFFWKISIHMALNVLGITFVMMDFGWQFAWLFALVPAVAWARFTLKKHTLHQLIAGGLLPFIELVMMKLF